MSNVYVVRTLPVRDAEGAIVGWVRADPRADGTKPTDQIFLRDGSSWDQAEAMERAEADPSLLYRTQDEAARDGLDRLRDAHARGLGSPLRR